MDVLTLVDELDELVHDARPVPLTGQVRVDRTRAAELVGQLGTAVSAEVEEASRILGEPGREGGDALVHPLLIAQLQQLVAEAKHIPLTGQVRIDGDAVHDLLDRIRTAFPGDVQLARRVVAERRAAS